MLSRVRGRARFCVCGLPTYTATGPRGWGKSPDSFKGAAQNDSAGFMSRNLPHAQRNALHFEDYVGRDGVLVRPPFDKTAQPDVGAVHFVGGNQPGSSGRDLSGLSFCSIARKTA